MIRLENVLKIFFQDVLKTRSKRLEDVLKMSWRRFCKTSWRRIEDVLARRLKNVLKTSWQDILKTSWRRIAKTAILVLTKTSWKRLEDVFWRRMAKENMFVLIKTSWRRLHQDECLLGYYKLFSTFKRIGRFIKMAYAGFCKIYIIPGNWEMHQNFWSWWHCKIENSFDRKSCFFRNWIFSQGQELRVRKRCGLKMC